MYDVCGNWDVLRPAKIVEGLEPISENLLDKLNEEEQNMIASSGVKRSVVSSIIRSSSFSAIRRRFFSV